jgi:hypothetical protein
LRPLMLLFLTVMSSSSSENLSYKEDDTEDSITMKSLVPLLVAFL